MDIRIGQCFKDNDPRMDGRVVKITAVASDGTVRYRPCMQNGRELPTREYTGLARRFHTDGKPRKSGFSLTITQRG